MPSFTSDYAILVFVATVGVVQMAASYGGLRGLLFVPSHLASRVLGSALFVGAWVWFFSTGERNINDYEGGVDANGQALYFFFASLGGVAFTLVLSSLVNLPLAGRTTAPNAGLDALRHTTYVAALWRNLKYWSQEWRASTRSYFSG